MPYCSPIDLAGIALRSGLAWRSLLVAEGVLGIVVLGGMGLVTGSVVLTWAGMARWPCWPAGSPRSRRCPPRLSS